MEYLQTKNVEKIIEINICEIEIAKRVHVFSEIIFQCMYATQTVLESSVL